MHGDAKKSPHTNRRAMLRCAKETMYAFLFPSRRASLLSTWISIVVTKIQNRRGKKKAEIFFSRFEKEKRRFRLSGAFFCCFFCGVVVPLEYKRKGQYRLDMDFLHVSPEEITLMEFRPPEKRIHRESDLLAFEETVAYKVSIFFSSFSASSSCSACSYS